MTDKVYDFLTAPQVTAAEIKAKRRAIVDAADQFLDYQERRVIILRYIDRASWSCIASVLHRSKSTIHRIHRSAGEKLSTICG